MPRINTDYGLAGFDLRVISNVTQDMSGVNVSKCAFTSKDDFLSI